MSVPEKLGVSKKYCCRCGDLYHAFACPSCKPPERLTISRLGGHFDSDIAASAYRCYRYLVLPETLAFIGAIMAIVGVISVFVFNEKFPFDLIGFQKNFLFGDYSYMHMTLNGGALFVVSLLIKRYRTYRFDDPERVARLAVAVALASLVFCLVNILFCIPAVLFFQTYMDASKHAILVRRRETTFSLDKVSTHERVSRIQNGSRTLWKVATSPAMKSFLDESYRKYRIPEERQLPLRTAIECVFLGIVHKEDFIVALRQSAGITNMGAATLADEICHHFLIHYEEELEATYAPIV